MNKDIFYSLSINELKETSNRLVIANSQLNDLLCSLEEERTELELTKDMLIKTLSEIAPKEKLVKRVFTKAKEIWGDLWKKETQSEDRDEWDKIMEELG
ncbi:hypothetical protein SteCoe_34406 [Stentor coeruleus]|uniref:Uncharacterized protein n=1 Tax=Stentor coeruleus TaxID=5963 RepID=A0A1R2AUJ8_9CILI|nr:hypothetical protein SteCoe_34406 [Stentor coeruleus]